MKFTFNRALATAGLLLMLAGGCGTFHPATIETRKKERPAAYAALPAEFREAVDAGKLKVGMNQDAVFFVWGTPFQMLSGGNAAGETQTWVYRSNYTQLIDFYGPRLRTAYVNSTYVSAQAVFEGGRLKEWQTFPRP